jgi:hypothetical protein
MNLPIMIGLLALSQAEATEGATADEVVEAPDAWVAPREGVHWGMGFDGTMNVLVHTDLFGVSGALHADLGLTRGRFEVRGRALLAGFSGWNGHDGYGWLLSGALEVGLRYHLWRRLAFGAGVQGGIASGQFQSCSEGLLDAAPGGCGPLVTYRYAFVAPVFYPVVATLGDVGQNELSLAIVIPFALDRSWTFPSVMLGFTHMF